MPDARELDEAIRAGLRDAGVREPATPTALILKHVLPLLVALEDKPVTLNEAVESIRRNGKVIRVGDEAALDDGRRIPSRILEDALLQLWREEQAKVPVPSGPPVVKGPGSLVSPRDPNAPVETGDKPLP